MQNDFIFAMTNAELRQAITGTTERLSCSLATNTHRDSLQKHLDGLLEIERSRAAMLAARSADKGEEK